MLIIVIETDGEFENSSDQQGGYYQNAGDSNLPEPHHSGRLAIR
jgi:hypothetical protein